jgi:hypothetical protein
MLIMDLFSGSGIALNQLITGNEDARALSLFLKPHVNVRFYFLHLHRPLSGSWENISFSTLHRTCHQT